MRELIFETHLEIYCDIYQIELDKWSKTRRQYTVILAMIVFFMVFLFLGFVPAVIAAVSSAYITYKIMYINLTNYDKVIKNGLRNDFPVFVVTFCALAGYYNNITNIFVKSVDYVDNKYYLALVGQFVDLVNLYPGEIDSHIFEFTNEIPSQNNLFFAKTVIDMNQKGFDQEIIQRLVDIVNSEFDNTINVLIESIPLKFIKFASLPIMISMLYLFMFTFGAMAMITASIAS